MIKFRFNMKKATQATAVLLRQSGKSQTENYLKIIKILYLADRTALERAGRPITGDRVVAMKHGPVLSNVLDLIRDRTFGVGDWRGFITTEHNNICLVNDPGNGELSPFEIDILHETWNTYRDVDPFDLADVTHGLSEYEKNKPDEGSAKDISFEDILAAVGRSDIQEIQEDAEQMSLIEGLYGQ